MNQEIIDLMKTILKMESAITRSESQLEILSNKYNDTEIELDNLRQQHRDNIIRLTSILNQ